MLERFQLISNVGQFDNAVATTQLPSFTKLSLVYGENGRGKTTLATILKSASTGNTADITERRRLGSPHQPNIVLTVAGTNRTFQNSVWCATSPQIVVFDDAFVAANVCSGIDIEPEHRQNLHELILGAQGVDLNTALVGHVARIEEHNRTIRQHESTIPTNVRGTLTVEQFCAIPNEDDIDAKIGNAERTLAASRNAHAIQERASFIQAVMPAIDTAQINEVLGYTLENVEVEATTRVREHLHHLGKDGESWISEGIGLIPSLTKEGGAEDCPFCKQDLATSPLIRHYKAYFSEAYEALKTTVTDIGKAFSVNHSSDIQVAFERSIREAYECRTFWSTYIEMPEFFLDTAKIIQSWSAARDLVLRTLRNKFSAPLETLQLSEDVITAIETYDQERQAVASAVNDLIAKNEAIEQIKQHAVAANIGIDEADFNRLRLIKLRHSEPFNALCRTYMDEKTAKTITEGLRDLAREALDNYRQNIFPIYQQTINEYLQRFGAGFQIDAVNSVNTRGRSSCTYNMVINQVPVPVTANGGASFRNTLSAGDRNTLALAFFFASLEQNTNLADAIVVIDDPMTSLDEHRSVATVQQIRALLARVRQVIVLSHFKPYLCEVWKGAPVNERSAFLLRRDGQGSSIAEWDVRQDCITEHDKNHALVAEFVRTGHPALERQAASALRPMLEAYLRVAYPVDFPPSALIGSFINRCRPRVGTNTELLNQQNIAELLALKDYGNNFHHDTNPAWQAQAINNQELTSFCTRVLRFTRR